MDATVTRHPLSPWNRGVRHVEGLGLGRTREGTLRQELERIRCERDALAEKLHAIKEQGGKGFFRHGGLQQRMSFPTPRAPESEVLRLQGELDRALRRVKECEEALTRREERVASLVGEVAMLQERESTAKISWEEMQDQCMQKLRNEASQHEASNHTDEAVQCLLDDGPALWIPDDQRKVCVCCAKRFVWPFVRRHHCRLCGEVFCGSCTRHRRSIVRLTPELSRVCGTCAG